MNASMKTALVSDTPCAGTVLPNIMIRIRGQLESLLLIYLPIRGPGQSSRQLESHLRAMEDLMSIKRYNVRCPYLRNTVKDEAHRSDTPVKRNAKQTYLRDQCSAAFLYLHRLNSSDRSH